MAMISLLKVNFLADSFTEMCLLASIQHIECSTITKEAQL